MNQVLNDLIEITSQRERAAIDAKLANVVLHLACASSVRLYAIAERQGVACLIPGASAASASDADRGNALVGALPARLPVTDFPALATALSTHAPAVREADTASCHVDWILLWDGARPRACLRVAGAAPLAAAILATVQGEMEIYGNFARVLDDSERDSLTGLLNRKTFDRQFANLISTMPHGMTPPDPDAERRIDSHVDQHWLAVIDIDHFKLVNDRFGHVYGDEVLILLANLLAGAFREQDRVFRFGGEEFVVLLRSATLHHAQQAFERARTRVEAHRFPQIERVTISAGFVSITLDTPVTILGHADEALYFAKEHGRNQVCFYDELVASGCLSGGAVRNQDADLF